MQDTAKNKTAHLVKTFGEIVENHRKSQGKTIYKISAEACLPKATIIASIHSIDVTPS